PGLIDDRQPLHPQLVMIAPQRLLALDHAFPVRAPRSFQRDLQADVFGPREVVLVAVLLEPVGLDERCGVVVGVVESRLEHFFTPAHGCTGTVQESRDPKRAFRRSRSARPRPASPRCNAVSSVSRVEATRGLTPAALRWLSSRASRFR